MLELVHPALQTDAVICAPKSTDCDDDIHVYAQRFDAWLRYETYAGRPYSPGEQVNKFINELSSSFAPAVSRIRRLLDAWNPFNLTTPEVLRITTLPNTIERFMVEETGSSTPHIRQMADKRGKQYKNQDNRRRDQGKERKCFYCGMDNHQTLNCDALEKQLIAVDNNLGKVDAKAKQALQLALKEQQRKRSERNQRRKGNVIRQILDTEGVENFLGSDNNHDNDQQTSEDDGHSTTSSDSSSA